MKTKNEIKKIIDGLIDDCFDCKKLDLVLFVVKEILKK